MRKEGTPLEDIDLLIAGIALANEMVIVRHKLGGNDADSL